MFKIFVTDDKHQRFKSSVRRHLPGLNIRPVTLKIRVLKFHNCLLFFRTAGYDHLQASIALCSFSFEMK